MTWWEPYGGGYRTARRMDYPQIGLTIPRGTPFNGSVPKRAQWFVHPHDPAYFEAFLLHDVVIRRGWSRQMAAGYFDHGLRNSDVPRWKRKILFVVLGLRKFG